MQMVPWEDISVLHTMFIKAIPSVNVMARAIQIRRIPHATAPLYKPITFKGHFTFE